MKTTILFLMLFFTSTVFSQDIQISNSGIYSVDIPHIAIDGANVHLVYGTNLSYYKFDIDGPAAPIDNPIIPASNYGPNTTDIAVDPLDPNHIAIAYYDYTYDSNTGVQFYGCYVTESLDGGVTFDIPTLIDTIEYGNSLSNISYNMPQVKFIPGDGTSSINILWRVNSNKLYTNALFLGERYGEPKRVDDPNKNALELAIGFTVEDDMIAISYGIMEEGRAKFYLYGTGINGPILVIDDGATFLTSDHYTKAFLNHDGNIKYIFNNFAHSAKLMESNDWGATWTDKGLIDSRKYVYIAFSRIKPIAPLFSESYYVKLLLDDNGDLVFYVSQDLMNWQDGGTINSESASIDYAGTYIDLVVDGVNKYLATAWIDNRTGNSEIFYAKVDLPELVSVESETGIPTEFTLMQNYPNPFNPSTTIQFALPKAEVVSLKIYNILGEEVAELVNREMDAGIQSINYDASNLGSGIYFYQIKAGSFVDVKKMLLVK